MVKRAYDFSGPIVGPLAIVVGLPLVCYMLVYGSNELGSLTLSGGLKAPGLPPGTLLATWEAAGYYLAFLGAQILLHLVLPGKRGQGVTLKDKSQLTYKFTGMYNLAVTLAVVYYFGFYRKSLHLAWIYENFLPLLTAAVLFSMLLSTVLYFASHRSEEVVTAEGGTTPSGFYNFFIGRELNPRIRSFDIKHFIELYPGLIGWLVIDLGMVVKQQQRLGGVTPALGMVTLFHFIYVVDALWMEPAILTTMDIAQEGLGFMLTFGNLAWVPFTYSLQARYLADHPQHLSRWGIAGIVALNALGYLIFRASNNQKNLFRRDPDHPWVKQLKTLKTERGTQLIMSGWWGISRHINYFGDWLLAWSWCLPCGFDHILPYFYVIYFGILLAHRERRDDRACREKYGKDWDKYCAEVRSRIIPLIY